MVNLNDQQPNAIDVVEIDIVEDVVAIDVVELPLPQPIRTSYLSLIHSHHVWRAMYKKHTVSLIIL